VEATRQILAERDVPIVALTGRSRQLAEEAVEAGATSYVLKPFVPREVVGALVDALTAHGELDVSNARQESRQALSHLLELLGYPEGWAIELEGQQFSRGHVWRIQR
jgi:DNA-binding response OmpR family regulator